VKTAVAVVAAAAADTGAAGVVAAAGEGAAAAAVTAADAAATKQPTLFLVMFSGLPRPVQFGFQSFSLQHAGCTPAAGASFFAGLPTSRDTWHADYCATVRRKASPMRAKDVLVARTSLGRGVFAQRSYDPGAVIGEIEGTVIDDWDYASNYCMDMGDRRCLEPAAPFRFVNHCCQPNCCFQWFDLTTADEPQPRRRVFLLAIEPIARGEELTIDYAWPPHMAIPCRCHAADCRGWVVAKEELAGIAAIR
jgi:hypothetical protein